MARRRTLAAATLAVTIVVLPSCATRLSPGAEAIKEVDESAVAGCRVVGKVEATSGWEGLSAAPGTSQAKTEALNDAAGRGVTHIVWDQKAKRSVAQSVTGKGYDCSPAGKAAQANPKPAATPTVSPAPPQPTRTPWPIPT